MNVDNNQVLYDDQSLIKKKINALYAFMFTISSGTKIHPIISFALIFLEDIQLIYFVTCNESVINLSESVRKFFSYIAFDNVNYSIYYYTQGCLNFVFFIVFALIALYVLCIPPIKFKENVITKSLRVAIILFYTVLFPFYTQLFVKTFTPKNGMLAAFPEIPYIGDQALLFGFSLLTFLSFIILEFCVFPFIFVNPTPFKKNNSLCQIYSFFNLKYNIAIIIISFISFYSKIHAPSISNYIFIILFLYMLISLSELLKLQPYYNKYINYCRSGTWTMIFAMGIVNLISYIFGRDKAFFGILMLVIGSCSFFVGIFLCRYKYKNHVEEIYKRYKQKKTEDKIKYNRDNGIVSSNGTSRSGDDYSKSSEEDENENNEDHLISVDSYSSSDNDNKKRIRKNDKDELNNSDQESEEEEEEYNSDNDSFQLNDRVSEKITAFSSIKDIMITHVSNEPIVVYEGVNEFELACRFIRNNETNEAFQLMKELYEESIKQYNKDPYLYTYYAYYLLYIDERTSKNEKDIIMGITNYNDEKIEEEEEEEEEKEEKEEEEETEDNEDVEDDNLINEDAINGNNPDYLLSKALSCKLNFLGKYFVRYLLFEIREKKKEDKDYYKKEALEVLVNLQHEAIEKHIAILNILKKFFSNIKYINSNHSESNNFNLDKYLEIIHHLKSKTMKLYQEIITKYPDEKSTYQLYTLFMAEIINQTDMDKYALNEGDSFMALNAPDQKNTKSANSNKLKSKYGGSVSSFGVSNAGGSTFGDSESKKKKMLKNNMIHSFTDRSNKISKFIIFMYILIIGLFITNAVYGFMHITNFNNEIKNIQIIEDINYNVHKIMRNARLMCFSAVLKIDFYIPFNANIIKERLDYMEENYIPILQKYSLKPASSYPVIIYSTDSNIGKTESEFVHLNGYELMRKVILWGRGISKYTPEELYKRIDAGENLLLDYKFRMFSDNFQYYYYNVFQESIDSMYEDEIASQNKQIYIMAVLSVILIILSISVNFFGIDPLYRNSKNLQKKTLRMFKYLLKGSLNEIISKFEIGIESISETYDISIDNKKNKISSIENQNVFFKIISNLNGYIISFILLGSISLLTLPIIIEDEFVIKSLNYNLQVGTRKQSILNINVFTYETLLQDIRSYLPGVAESYLYNEISKLEDLQSQMYKGTLGLESTAKMRYLDSLIINRQCRLDEDVCESIEEVYEQDYTKNIVKLGLNEFIEEYIDKSKSVLYGSNIKDYKNEEHMYRSIVESDDQFLLDCFADYSFMFQFNTIDHLIAGLEKFDQILYDNLFQSIRGTMVKLIIIVIIGLFLILISIVLSIRSIRKTTRSLNELINMIFIIPTSTINMIPQFKRFIETGSFEEE